MDIFAETAGGPVLFLFRGLLNQAGMILVFAFLFSRIPLFRSYLVSSRRRAAATASFILFFGALGVLGTYTGIPVRGAIANSRIIGVFVAGLLGGPLVGLGAGLVAGVHRWAIDIGGFTALACMVSTIVESALAGFLSERFYRSERKWLFAMFAGAAAEVLQMIIILLIARPLDEVIELVKIIGLPMVVANGLGIGMFVAVVETIFRERDRVAAGQAQTTLRIANQTMKHFREGFDERSAIENARIILASIDVAAVAFSDTKSILAHVGLGEDHHAAGKGIMTRLTREVLESGVYRVAVDAREIGCLDPACELRSAIIVPLHGKRAVLGTFKIYKDYENGIGPIDVELALGLANLFATQIELGQLEDQQRLVAKAELHALQAQINPHFLFNAINTIASLTRSDPESARTLLVRLGSFFRKSLATQDELVPLREELEQVESYLGIEKARFGDKLTVVIDVPESVDCLIPPFLIQPLVENAVKHGIQQKVGAGRVEITAREGEDAVEVEVADDGAGMDGAKLAALFTEGRDRRSIGLVNINDRMKNLYGNDHGLTVTSEAGKGTIVKLRIPREARVGNHRDAPRR